MATSASVAPGAKLTVLLEAVVDEGLHGGLHAHVLFGGDVAGDDEGIAHGLRAGRSTFWQVPSRMIWARISSRFSGSMPALPQRVLEGGRGVGQLEVFAVVVDVADVGQGEDRLAAVALAAGDGGDGAGGGDGGLGGVADAVVADAGDNRVPIDRRGGRKSLTQ